MDCLEFRRRTLADPLHPGSAALEHEAGCAECARFYLSLRRQEEDLHRVLSESTPEGLADRILLKRRPRLPDVPPYAWLTTLAAVLVLAVGVGLLMPPRGMRPESLAVGLIAHVLAEPEALAAEQSVSPVRLAHAFARGGGELPVEPALTATYAGRCPLPGGGVGEHIVLRTANGKVTLILMPDKPVPAALRLVKDGLHLSLLPVGAGSLALVAETDELVRETQEGVLGRVHWARHDL
jgi:hypothetical protein